MYQQIFKLIILPLVLICFGLLPTTQAQLPSPTPDGGYLNGNTAEGHNALFSLTTGTGNTAVGDDALVSNTMGNFNTANGIVALTNNTTGSNNTATGAGALFSNTTISSESGHDNTADGFVALASNTTGNENTATGSQALDSNSTGVQNTAIGRKALEHNTTGNENTAVGNQALENNTGNDNTAIGSGALSSNTAGAENIALGLNAGENLTTGNGNIDIGNVGVAGEADTIRIGTNSTQTKTFIAGINGVNQGSPTAVFINTTTGQLGTTAPTSSRRFKKEIKAMDKASEGILALKPVTFKYKSDDKGTPQFGLIAEEVAKVSPDVVVYDPDGKPYSVRYDAVNAMLLNEFLKEHKAFLEEQRKVQRLEAALAAVNERLKAQDAKIDKVNGKVELTKPAPQTVLNQ